MGSSQLDGLMGSSQLDSLMGSSQLDSLMGSSQLDGLRYICNLITAPGAGSRNTPRFGACFATIMEPIPIPIPI